SDTVCWSQSTSRSKMRCDEAWARADASAVAKYIEHRKAHMMPPDFTHIQQLDELESADVEKNTATTDAAGANEEEDESEEFVLSYYNSCDRVWVANAEVGGKLKIIEATWGSSAAAAVVSTDQVQSKVADG
ncbi:unnamed protein product, partial [Amoebophrya sp. A120]